MLQVQYGLDYSVAVRKYTGEVSRFYTLFYNVFRNSEFDTGAEFCSELKYTVAFSECRNIITVYKI